MEFFVGGSQDVEPFLARGSELTEVRVIPVCDAGGQRVIRLRRELFNVDRHVSISIKRCRACRTKRTFVSGQRTLFN